MKHATGILVGFLLAATLAWAGYTSGGRAGVNTFTATVDIPNILAGAQSCAAYTVTNIIATRAVTVSPDVDAPTCCAIASTRPSTGSMFICVQNGCAVAACNWGTGTWMFTQAAG